jgi:RNA polymerase sigma-70 factor, ECF subfamily
VAPSDAALVERCKGGDTQAFNALVARHQHRVVNIAFRFVRDPDRAHDLAQEAFLSAFRNLGKFRGDSAFSTWLFRITYNVCMDELKKRRRAPEQSVEAFYGDDEGDTELRIPDGGDTPEEAAERIERRRAVWRALDRLPTHHREVIVLFDIEGVPYEEMATILECPIGTVKSRLSRARKALLDELGPDLELFAS